MKDNQKGFTLVELMIAMAMTGIVVAIIYSAYDLQTKIYTEQDKTADMQQNIRAALVFLQREARMAGYNPTRSNHASCNRPGETDAVSPGIHTATATTLGFSMDLDEDGDCDGTGENVTYSIYTASDGLQKLGRAAPTTNQAIAENITNIDFVYLFKPPLMGSPASDPPTATPATDQLDEIVAAQITVLAQALEEDRSAPTTLTFTAPFPDAWGQLVTGAGTQWGPFSDSRRRRLMTTSVNFRNMGLK